MWMGIGHWLFALTSRCRSPGMSPCSDENITHAAQAAYCEQISNKEAEVMKSQRYDRSSGQPENRQTATARCTDHPPALAGERDGASPIPSVCPCQPIWTYPLPTRAPFDQTHLVSSQKEEKLRARMHRDDERRTHGHRHGRIGPLNFRADPSPGIHRCISPWNLAGTKEKFFCRSPAAVRLHEPSVGNFLRHL